MAEGCDYSFSRPDPTCLAAAGKRFVMRYVGHDPRGGKDLTRAEADALIGVGLKIVTIHQPGPASRRLLGGYDWGYADARDAHGQATGAGMPEWGPIMFSLDTDPAGLTTRDWANVKAYLIGAGSVLGNTRVGLYGGFEAIERMCPVPAWWGFQTSAWSAGRWSPLAQIQQYRFNVGLCGGTVDLDRSTDPNYGYWPR